MAGILKKAIADRVGGKRPSRLKAAAAAIAAGAAVAALTYGELRG